MTKVLAVPMDDTLAAADEILVGVLSDTHGHLYPQVLKLLEGVDHIIHAGDIGSPGVLSGIKALASVTAVRGNCDHGGWAASLPQTAFVELAGIRILVQHIGHRRSEGQNGPRVVVSGHTHRPEIQERGDVLYLNPGSAGPERFGRPRTMAYLRIIPQQTGSTRESGPMPVDAHSEQAERPPRVSAQYVMVPLD